MFIDFHVHPTLKAFRQKRNFWDTLTFDKKIYKKLPWIIQKSVQEIAVDSQSNLKKVNIARIKCSILSLVCIEKQYFDINRKNVLLNLLLKPKHHKYLAQTLLGLYEQDAIAELAITKNPDSPVNYWDELQEQYAFMTDETYNTYRDRKMVIVKDYDMYNTLKYDESIVRMVISIEGANALLNYPSYGYLNSIQQDDTLLRAQLSANISALKSWGGGDHAPFFITICHFFWNHFSGHSKSLGPQKGVLFKNKQWNISLVPGMENMIRQEVGLDEGITALGWLLIELLLDKTNGKRILIDTKHMSLKARLEYYEYIEKKALEGDQIPIINSHAAVNGVHKYADSVHYPDVAKTDVYERFSRWSINLYDEEIIQIHKSGGIIAVMLHEKRLPGAAVVQRLNQLKKRRYQKKLKATYISLMMGNIFQIVAVINHPSAWDIIAIGTDLDGLVDAFDNYDNIFEYLDIINDIQSYLNDIPNNNVIYKNNVQHLLTVEEMKRLMFNISPMELAEKIAYHNAEQFMKKYFTDDYRRH